MTPFKKSFIFLACFAFAQVVTSCAADSALRPTSHLVLFNGHDLAGWTTCMRTNSDSSQTWTVTNGVIHCTGQPAGFLRTLQSYHDYKLSVTWRFVKIAPKLDNTGVLVHMQLPDKVWPPCVQVQGKHDHQGDLFVMSGAECKEHQGMDANTPVAMHGDSAEKPVGEWNTSDTLCSGDSVKSFINDKLMNEITQCTVTNGFVGFQSEGADMEIRSVALDPLPK
jgi:hypothetical protein